VLNKGITPQKSGFGVKTCRIYKDKPIKTEKLARTNTVQRIERKTVIPNQ